MAALSCHRISERPRSATCPNMDKIQQPWLFDSAMPSRRHCEARLLHHRCQEREAICRAFGVCAKTGNLSTTPAILGKDRAAEPVILGRISWIQNAVKVKSAKPGAKGVWTSALRASLWLEPWIILQCGVDKVEDMGSAVSSPGNLVGGGQNQLSRVGFAANSVTACKVSVAVRQSS